MASSGSSGRAPNPLPPRPQGRPSQQVGAAAGAGAGAGGSGPPPPGPPPPPPPPVGTRVLTTVTRTCGLAKAVRAAGRDLTAWVGTLDCPLSTGPGGDPTQRLLKRIDAEVMAMGVVTRKGSRLLELLLRMLADEAPGAAPPAPGPPGPPGPPAPPAADQDDDPDLDPGPEVELAAGLELELDLEDGPPLVPPLVPPPGVPLPLGEDPYGDMPAFAPFMPAGFDWGLAIRACFAHHTKGSTGPRKVQPGFEAAVARCVCPPAPLPPESGVGAHTGVCACACACACPPPPPLPQVRPAP